MHPDLQQSGSEICILFSVPDPDRDPLSIIDLQSILTNHFNSDALLIVNGVTANGFPTVLPIRQIYDGKDVYNKSDRHYKLIENEQDDLNEQAITKILILSVNC
jgi:hypothetical protein